MQKYYPVLLFLLALLVFNLNLRAINTGDTVPASLLPFCILLDGSVTFDRYHAWYVQHCPCSPYFFTLSRGHYYSSYPVTLPLLITPLYLPVAALGDVQEWPVDKVVALARVLEKLIASLIAALSVSVFFSLAKR